MSLRKVLVVDDSELAHSMHDSALESYGGCDVLHAYNGLEAFETLQKNPDVKLILLDMNMPLMDGLTFLRTRRESGRFAEVPVIVVSTEGSEADARRGLDAGAAAYLTKPFRAAELHGLIDGLATRV